jgi:hypothetical protein
VGTLYINRIVPKDYLNEVQLDAEKTDRQLKVSREDAK